MNYRMLFGSRVLLAVGLTMVWAGAAEGQSEEGKDRDPALLLQRTRRARETPRSYDSTMDIDFGLMRLGQTKKKEKPVHAPDIPEARDGFSLDNLTPPQREAYAPPVRPDREDETKKNWILPPKPHLDEEPEEFSNDPAEMMMRMYEDEVAARSSLIEGVLSGSTFTLGGTEERSPRDDERSSRYSEYDGGLREAGDNFLYSEEDGLADETDDSGLYSPVITDTVFQDQGDRTREPTAIARLNPDQLEGLSNEELAALADRESQTEQDDVGLDDTERLSGIEQFTREGGVDQPSVLRRTQAILSGSGTVPLPSDGEASGSSPAAGALAGDSWRGSLSTLSAVLHTTPVDSVSPGATPMGGRIFGGGFTDASASRIRDQFSPGSGFSSSIGFSPAASTGLGSIGSDLARPTSLGLGSGFSSGITPSGSIGGGDSSISQPLSPAPRKRSLDVRSLDILMN